VHWRAYEELEVPLVEDVFDSIVMGLSSHVMFYIQSTCKTTKVLTLHEVPPALRYLLSSFDLTTVRVIGIVPKVAPFVARTDETVFEDLTLDDEAYLYKHHRHD
jgi:hypothetical protein